MTGAECSSGLLCGPFRSEIIPPELEFPLIVASVLRLPPPLRRLLLNVAAVAGAEQSGIPYDRVSQAERSLQPAAISQVTQLN